MSTSNNRRLGKYLLMGAAFFLLFAARPASANVLLPGTVTTCGELATVGTYTLGNSISTSTGPCLIVTSGGTSTQTVINGAGFTVNGSVSGNGVNEGDPGHSFTVKNATVTGTTSANGADDDTTGTAGSGGNIIISNSTTTALTSTGGSSFFFGGVGGSITVSQSFTTSISTNGGTAEGGNNDGNAGAVIISTSTTGNITANGGAGSVHSGNGASITIATSTVGSVSSVGGAATNTGGNGGTMTLTNSIATSLNSSGGTGDASDNAGSAGAITVRTSTVTGSVTSNGAGVGTPTAGGNITVSTSTIGSIISIGGSSSGHTGAAGGAINATSSTITSITSSGGAGTSGQHGGAGGAVNFFNSTTTSITSNGGTGSVAGNGGAVVISSSQLNIQNVTVSATGATAGTLTFNYSTIQYSNLTLSALSNVIFNGVSNLPGSLGAFAGGIYPAIAMNTLSPGTINTCGRIYSPGTYTLGADLSIGGVCITMSSSSAVINGGNNGLGGHYSITGNVVGNGLTYGNPGYNFTLQNLAVVGTTSSNGVADDGSCTVGGGSGGTITMTNASSTVITADAGGYVNCDPTVTLGGSGGTVTLSGTNIDLSATTISARKGHGRNDLGGTVTVSYTNTVNVSGLHISALSNFTVNSPLNTPGSLGSTAGGIIGALPGGTVSSAAQCNLAFAGTYTLGSNIAGSCSINSDGVVVNGAGFSISGQVIGSNLDSYSNAHSFTLQNVTVTGMTTSAAVYGVIGSLASNCFDSYVPGLSGGNITVTNSTLGSIVADGSVAQIYNSNQCGDYGIAGSVTVSNSRFTSIESQGNTALGTPIINVSGSALDLSSVSIDLTGTHSSSFGGILNLAYSTLTTNGSTFFHHVNQLYLNGFSIGQWNAVYNPSGGLYFNDKNTHDGNWNDPANWWSDASTTIAAGTVPTGFLNFIVNSSVTDNTGISPITANTVTFNNGAINAVNINATQVTFNATSSNMGTVSGGQAVFNGNLSENNATSSLFIITPRGSSALYTAIAYAASTTKLMATDLGGDVYFSNDSGATWTLTSTVPSNPFDPGGGVPSITINPLSINQSLTISSDGSKSALINNDGQVYTSTNSGASWTANGVYRQWNSITSSADGTKIAAAATTNTHFLPFSSIYGGAIYISTNSGATWTVSTSSPPTSWTSVAASPDGTRLIAVGSNGIYISGNFGTTWTLSTSSPTVSQFIYTSNGNKLIGFGSSTVYASTDFGLTWSATSSPSFPSGAVVTASSDGTKLAAVVSVGNGASGPVYFSTDSGTTWTPRGSDQSWTDVTSSADGTKIAAVTESQIYTMSNSATTTHRVGTIASSTPIRQYTTNTVVGTRNFTLDSPTWIIQANGAVVNISSSTYNTSVDTFQALNGGSFIINPAINGGAAVTPQFSVSSPAVSSTTTKWLPSISWSSSTAVTCEYSYDNFVTTHVVACANNGSDIPKPASAGAQTLYLEGIDSRGDAAETIIPFTYDNVSPVYTLCGSDLLDEPTRKYYYLSGAVSGDCTATANITLYGSSATTSTSTGFTINGNVVATSPTNGYNITINNVRVTGTINASGGANSAGGGYNGGNISIDPSTTGNIVSNGGDGTSGGGNGGNITIVGSTGIAGNTTISANGGNATLCGPGGNGGSISLTNSAYGAQSNAGGKSMTLTFGQGGYCSDTVSYGSAGSGGTSDVVGVYTPPPVASALAIAPENQDDNVAVQPAQDQSSAAAGSVTNPEPSGIAGLSLSITQNINTVTDEIKSFGAAASAIRKAIINTAGVVADSPITKTVQATTFFGGLVAAFALYSNIGLAATSSSGLLLPVNLWGLTLMGLGIKKRTRRWGTVYDSVTKQPIDPAVVTASDANGKIVGESITDLDGRYGFLLPDGTYYISVKKTNYEFPSKKMAGKESDELYTNLYFGGPVAIGSGEVLDKNIPMDQLNFDWNEHAKRERNLMSFHSRNEKFWAVATKYIYGVGLAISIITVLVRPSLYNISVLVLYVSVIVFLEFGIKRRKLGRIFDKNTNEPLSYAIVRVTTLDHQVVLHSGASDAKGRYYCIVPKGRYLVDIEKKNPDGSYSMAYESPEITSASGIINTNFAI